MQRVTDESLNYTISDYISGNHEMVRVVANNGIETVNITGGQEVIFALPPNSYYNLNKSEIQFDLTFPAPAATAFNWVPLQLPFNQVELYTSDLQYMVTITDFEHFYDMTKAVNNLDYDVQGWDKIGGPLAAPAATSTTGYFEGLNSCNCLNTLNLMPWRNPAGINVGAAFPGVTNYLENQYCVIYGPGVAPVVGPPALPASPTFTIPFRIGLDKISHSFFKVNKDIYAKQAVYLRIVFSNSQRLFFTATAGTSSLGAATPAAGTVVTLNNLQLLLATQRDKMIISIIDKEMDTDKGVIINTDYVVENKLPSISPSTSQTLTVLYNIGQGHFLKKIYWAPYNTNEYGGSATDHNNAGGQNINRFYTMLNTQRLNTYDWDCTLGRDWSDKRLDLRGTTIYSSQEYYNNWVYIEDFTHEKVAYKDLLDNTVYVEGVPLAGGIRYDIYATTAAASFNHYLFSVCTKFITINKNGIRVG